MKTAKKATLHVSIDPTLSERLRRVCEAMGLPISHFTSLALSREVARFEVEFALSAPPDTAERNA
ncbi:MAG: hypothetical protein NVSMB6_20670 [Burkholderiaceae bacterium]